MTTGEEPETRAATRREPDTLPLEPREESLSAGTRLGPWQITRLAGRGGMGEVYEAQRADGTFAMRAAVKLLKRGLDTDAVVARFNRERRILAQLDHPNIAHVLDAGVAPDGRPFLVMEYVEGTPITDYARSRNLAIPDLLRLMITVSEAVQAAHGKHIVHRDLKPSNVLVTAQGQVKLLDFGIAKALTEEDDSDATRLGGSSAMTPSYAAPEQLLELTATPASDVYALGCILYQLLVERLPHARGGRSTREVAKTLDRETIERPSTVLRKERGRLPEPQRLQRLKELSADLDLIVLKALHQEAQRRYANAQGLADDLQRLLDSRPVLARPDSATYRAGRFIRRNRLPVAAALAVVTALSIGLALALWQAHNAKLRRQQADDLINFMLGDLQEALDEVGRLDVLDTTLAKTMDYVGQIDVDTADTMSLEQAANTYASIEILASARGRLPDAKLAGQKALVFAREFQRRNPGESADFILATALSAVSAADPNLKDATRNIAILNESLNISRGLVARSPQNAKYRLLMAADADSLGYYVSYGQGNALEGARLHEECMRTLNPIVLRVDAGNQYVRQRLVCENNHLAAHASLVDARQTVVDAAAALARFPKDFSLLQCVTSAYRLATRVLSRYGNPVEALAVGREGLTLGRRMQALEPDDAVSAWIVIAMLEGISNAERENGDVAAAVRDADEALAKLEVRLKSTPDFSNLRIEMARLRGVRMRNAMAMNARVDEVLAEADAGRAVLDSGDRGAQVLRSVLEVDLLKWWYALSARPQLVPETRGEALKLIEHLNQAHDSSAEFLEWKVGADYLDGHIDEGDQLFRSRTAISALPMSSEIKEIRRTMCASLSRAAAKACAPSPD